jgi:hypothetical protein
MAEPAGAALHHPELFERHRIARLGMAHTETGTAHDAGHAGPSPGSDASGGSARSGPCQEAAAASAESPSSR